MSKIQELKSKLSAKLAPIKEKFFKKKSEGDGSNSSASKPGAIATLRKFYQEGNVFQKFFVVVIYLSFFVGILSALKLGALFFHRRDAFIQAMHKGTEKYDKMEEYLKRKAEIKHDITSTVSMDKIKINTIKENGQRGNLSISIWVRCDSPQTAKEVENIYPKLHDSIVTELQEIHVQEATTEEGKNILKEKMKKIMNSVIGENKIQEVFFHDVIFE